MSIVIMGDVASAPIYHVGDEAMTEYAVDALRARGVHDLTIVGGDPDIAAQRFHANTIPRPGFQHIKEDPARHHRFETLRALLDGHRPALPTDDPIHTVIETVRQADGVLIAGGGNIRTVLSGHLYDRAALGLIARHYKIPFALTSQTFGPELRPRHRGIVAEMLAGADLVGSRERTSYDLALTLGSAPERTHRGVDDGLWLRPHQADRDRIATFDLPERYLLVAFTSHPGTTGWKADHYHQRVATTIDALAETTGLHPVLVPHVGAFDDAHHSYDQVLNDGIAARATSNPIVLPMVTAREAVALTESATLSLSSRYHAAVFATGAGVPAIGTALSYYGLIKLRGALGNAGLKDFAIPVASWRTDLLGHAANDLLADPDALAAHFAQVRAIREPDADIWWDTLTATLTRAGSTGPLGHASEVAPYGAPAPWKDEIRATSTLAENTGQKIAERDWKLARAHERIAELEAQLAARPRRLSRILLRH